MTLQVIHGDCLDVLPTLAAGSVDCVVTDPPYGTGAWLRPGTGLGGDCRATLVSPEWDEWDVAWLEAALRVTPNVASFCLSVRVAELWGKMPGVKRLLYWVKSDPRPRFSGQLGYGVEPIVVAGRLQPVGGIDYCNATAPRLNRDREGVDHPTQKPLCVLTWLLRILCPPGGTVLDPFLGSGTTLVACAQLGLNGIGIEQDAGYCEIARARIEAAQQQGRLAL